MDRPGESQLTEVGILTEGDRQEWVISSLLAPPLVFGNHDNSCGMEEDPGNRYTAWALDFPGCFAYGADEAEALLNLPRALLEFDYWVRLHIEKPWYELDGLDFHVDETFVVTRVDHNAEEYEINAFFLDDLRPLSAEELKQTDLVFSWQHEELLAGVEFVDRPKLEEIQPGERWSILGILGHLAQAEVWYLQNLGGCQYPHCCQVFGTHHNTQLVRQYCQT